MLMMGFYLVDYVDSLLAMGFKWCNINRSRNQKTWNYLIISFFRDVIRWSAEVRNCALSPNCSARWWPFVKTKCVTDTWYCDHDSKWRVLWSWRLLLLLLLPIVNNWLLVGIWYHVSASQWTQSMDSWNPLLSPSVRIQLIVDDIYQWFIQPTHSIVK